MRAQIRELFATRRSERLALLVGLLTGFLGVALAANELLDSPQLDYHAYYFTGRAVLDGREFVGTAIHDGTFLTVKEYVYPPVTGPVFAPYGLFPRWEVGYVLNIALLAATFYAVGRITIRYIERHGGSLERADRMLILGFTLLSGHTVLGLYRGNIDPIILLLIVGGFLAVERGQETTAGTLWAVAALFKLFPAVLGLWLLYQRAYRAVAAALVTGVGGMAVGVAVFGVDAHVRFFDFLLNERSRQGAFEGGLDPEVTWITLRRPLSQLLALSGNQLILVSAALMAPVVAFAYYEAETPLDRTVAFFVTMLVLLITLVPSTLNYVIYLYFPLVALVYLVEDRRTNSLLVAGLVLVSLPLYPQHVEMLVTATPLPPGAVDAILGVVRAVLSYVSIPLVGFLTLLAGCLRYLRLPAPDRRPAADPEPDVDPGP